MEDQVNKDRRYCPNCYYPMAKDTIFCGHCGQKYTTGKIKLGALLQDFVESVLNIDSKVFRTIGALFSPGKLTNEYFKGRHKDYIAPLRIFFFMAVVHFAVIGFTQVEILKLNVFGSNDQDPRKLAYHDVFLDELDTARLVTLEEFNNSPTAEAVIDSLFDNIKDTRGDSVGTGYLYYKGGILFESKEVTLAKKDMVDMPIDTLFSTYKIEGLMAQWQVQQFIKLLLEGNSFFNKLILGNMIWMVILMMPALALILKLLYIRRKRYFVEHLVFSFHYHTFAFFIVSVGFLVQSLFPEDEVGWVVAVAYAALLPYLFIAMRRVYEQGRFKTFLKFTFLNFSYLVIFLVFFLITALISALTF